MKDLLTSSSLLASISPEQAQQIVARMRRVELAAGQLLGSEGEPSNSLHIIVSGEIEVLQALGSAEERLLAVRREGDFLGEASMFDAGGLRVATLRARSPVTVLELSYQEFELLLRATPGLAYEVARQVSLRQRSSDNQAILELQAKNRALAQAYADLQAAQAQVVEKEKLERELQLARQIQFSILPQKLPRFPGWDLGACLASARFVGGDLYDAIALGDGRVGLMIGDVSDKGVPAGLFMALARSLLRAEAGRHERPASVLLSVNAHLLEMNQAGMFVTMLYGVLDLHSGAFEYARAGHELPLLYNAAGELQPVGQGHGMLLGVFPDPPMDEQTVIIPPGGTLLLYTDGAPDAINPQGQRYGKEQLSATVRQMLDQAPLQALCDNLLHLLQAYHAGQTQADDITLLAIRNLL